MISKRAVYTLIGIATVFVLVAGALAPTVDPGSIPFPGQPLSEFQGFFQDDPNLETSLGKVQQRVSGECLGAGQMIKAIGLEGNVVCETGLQRRVSIACPVGQSMTAIAPDGTPSCTPDDASGLDATTCLGRNFVNSVDSDGSVECSSSPYKCVWQGREYTPGAKCNPTSHCFTSLSTNTNKTCTCQSDGSWSCVLGGSYPCYKSC